MPRKMEKGSDIPQGGGVSSNALDLYRQRAEDERKIESRNFAKAQKTINDIASWFWNKEVQEQIRSVGAEADGFKRFTFRLKIGKQGLAPCGKRPWWSKVQKKRKQELYSDGS